MTIRVLLACKDEAVHRLFAQLQRTSAGLMTDTTARLDELVERVANSPTDVLLLECSPQEAPDVAQVLAKIAQASPATRVLMLWDYYTSESLLAFVKCGARGCLLKSSSAALYAKAIASVHAGETWFGRSDLVEAMRTCMKPAARIAVKLDVDDSLLTPREREILSLIGTGMTNKEIGRRLAISDQTVKTHLHHVYVKLEQSGRFKAFLAQPAQARLANGA